jgi:hypothetical protein
LAISLKVLRFSGALSIKSLISFKVAISVEPLSKDSPPNLIVPANQALPFQSRVWALLGFSFVPLPSMCA